MKKVLIFTLCLSALLLAACASGGNGSGDSSGDSDGLIVIGFSQVGSESDWRLANSASMRSTFSEDNGYRLIFRDAQQRQENQISAIREFISQKVNYIVFAPIAEEGWDEVLGEAKAAGIPVIIVDRMINTSDDSLFTCWVGSDFRREGDTAVAWMEETFSDREELRIVHLQGSMGSSAQIGRTEGLDEGVARNPGWEIISRTSGDFNQVDGKERMEYILTQFDSFDVLYSENDNMAFGAMEAMEANGMAFGVDRGVTVISFDATHAGLAATLDGGISFNVECNPLHGPRVEAIIMQLERGETPDKLAYVTEEAFYAKTITQEIIDARDY